MADVEQRFNEISKKKKTPKRSSDCDPLYDSYKPSYFRTKWKIKMQKEPIILANNDIIEAAATDRDVVTDHLNVEDIDSYEPSPDQTGKRFLDRFKSHQQQASS